jgi:hypothetical protein
VQKMLSSTTANEVELFALSPQIALADEAAKAGDVCEAAEEIFWAAPPPKPTLPEVDVSSEEWFKALQAKMASDKNRPPAPDPPRSSNIWRSRGLLPRQQQLADFEDGFDCRKCTQDH